VKLCETGEVGDAAQRWWTVAEYSWLLSPLWCGTMMSGTPNRCDLRWRWVSACPR